MGISSPEVHPSGRVTDVTIIPEIGRSKEEAGLVEWGWPKQIRGGVALRG